MSARVRGRLVLPALHSLLASAARPLPYVVLRSGRCGGCGARGIGFAVLPGDAGGFCGTHRGPCPMSS